MQAVAGRASSSARQWRPSTSTPRRRGPRRLCSGAVPATAEGRFQAEAGREDRQPAEQVLFSGAQEVIAPGDRGPQGLLAGRGGARAA